MPDKESRSRQGDASGGVHHISASWTRVGLEGISTIIELTFRCNSKTLQTTEANIVSGFGWGLTKRIENYGLTRFKANVQRVCVSPPVTTCAYLALVSRRGLSHPQPAEAVSSSANDTGFLKHSTFHTTVAYPQSRG
jgi:hypothetical protein